MMFRNKTVADEGRRDADRDEGRRHLRQAVRQVRPDQGCPTRPSRSAAPARSRPAARRMSGRFDVGDFLRCADQSVPAGRRPGHGRPHGGGPGRRADPRACWSRCCARRATGASARVARGYIWFFRGTPLLIQMVMIYSGLPQLGIKFGVLHVGDRDPGAERGGLHGRDHPRRLPRRAGRPARRRQGARPVAQQALRKVPLPQAIADHPAGAGQFGERAAEGHVDRLGDLDGGADAAQRDDHAGEVRRARGLRRGRRLLPGADDAVGPRPALARTPLRSRC